MLADDDRVEPGRDLEQVAGGLGVPLDGQVVDELGGGQEA